MPEGKDLDGKWVKGISSLFDPDFLEQGEYGWLINGDNSGGVISPRQGFAAVGISDQSNLPSGQPYGGTVFKDVNGDVHIVVACNNLIWKITYPFLTGWTNIGSGFTKGPVVFTRTVKTTDLDNNGNVTVLSAPFPILIMQNGTDRARAWDGLHFAILPPVQGTNRGHDLHPLNCPVGLWMQWSGGRLWLARDDKLRASDFGDPLHWYETTYVAGGGDLQFDDTITGMGQTSNLQSLLVGTSYNTSSVRTDVYDRTQWASTPGFQVVVLPGIGCAAGKSFTRQWGMVWWYSHGGMIALDQALNAYRTSNIQYQDQGMLKSKAKLSRNLSSICMSSFGNYLLAAVPYSAPYNSQIWKMNQRPVDLPQPTIAEAYRVPVWASVENGIFPVEFMQSVINGQQRLFALSYDPRSLRPTVWEMFTGERRDRYSDTILVPPVIFETRTLLLSDDIKRFEYADLDFSEIEGVVSVIVAVAGRKGPYHTLLNKRIVGSRGSINSVVSTAIRAIVTQAASPNEAQLFFTIDPTYMSLDPTTQGNPFITGPSTAFINGQPLPYTSISGPVNGVYAFEGCTVPSGGAAVGDLVIQPQYTFGTIHQNFRTQKRMLRTSQFGPGQDPSCQTCGVESIWEDRIDRGFTIFVGWSGRATLKGIRAFASKIDEAAVGRCEEDENAPRFVNGAGCGTLVGDLEELETTTSASQTSQILPTFTPRYYDLAYYSDPQTIPR